VFGAVHRKVLFSFFAEEEKPGSKQRHSFPSKKRNWATKNLNIYEEIRFCVFPWATPGKQAGTRIESSQSGARGQAGRRKNRSNSN
jgi:hypothetical protein